MKRQPARPGIHIRGHRGHPEVRAALIQFARWLRTQYDFPIRVPVYLLPGVTVPPIDGRECSAAFFAPDNRNDEPIIRIATGEYPSLAKRYGRHRALASFIVSMSHEVIHYQQWLDDGMVTERGVARSAISMLRRYEKSVRRL